MRNLNGDTTPHLSHHPYEFDLEGILIKNERIGCYELFHLKKISIYIIVNILQLLILSFSNIIFQQKKIDDSSVK